MQPLSPVPKKVREETLPPLREQTDFYDSIEAEMVRAFREKIFVPLAADLNVKPSKVTNAKQSPLGKAIQLGKITYADGTFSGSFEATTTKELKSLGATWDKKTSSFKLPIEKLPYDIRAEISSSDARQIAVMAKLETTLAKISPEEVAAAVKAKGLFDDTLWKSDVELRKQLNPVAIVPKLTDSQRARIAEDYTTNLQLYIKDWTEKQIIKMRKEVQELALKGARQDQVIEMLKENYGQSQSKAKFLARQETSLMLSKFRQTRYEQSGVEEYVWQCVVGSPKHPVRPQHKKLDGTRQRWDNPPITNEKGERNHPGEDFNCRCVARPIVKF